MIAPRACSLNGYLNYEGAVNIQWLFMKTFTLFSIYFIGKKQHYGHLN